MSLTKWAPLHFGPFTENGKDILTARNYADTEDNDPSRQELLGRSPLVANLPVGDHRFRMVKQGFEPVDWLEVELMLLLPNSCAGFIVGRKYLREWCGCPVWP
jgi:hypothetical protein